MDTTQCSAENSEVLPIRDRYRPNREPVYIRYTGDNWVDIYGMTVKQLRYAFKVTPTDDNATLELQAFTQNDREILKKLMKDYLVEAPIRTELQKTMLFLKAAIHALTWMFIDEPTCPCCGGPHDASWYGCRASSGHCNAGNKMQETVKHQENSEENAKKERRSRCEKSAPDRTQCAAEISEETVPDPDSYCRNHEPVYIRYTGDNWVGTYNRTVMELRYAFKVTPTDDDATLELQAFTQNDCEILKKLMKDYLVEAPIRTERQKTTPQLKTVIQDLTWMLDEPRCAHCGGSHDASWRGCKAFSGHSNVGNKTQEMVKHQENSEEVTKKKRHRRRHGESVPSPQVQQNGETTTVSSLHAQMEEPTSESGGEAQPHRVEAAGEAILAGGKVEVNAVTEGSTRNEYHTQLGAELLVTSEDQSTRRCGGDEILR